MELIFWISLFVVFWTYFGYFIYLAFLTSMRSHKVSKLDITPDVTLVITAFNEEHRIREKIENSLSLNYPDDKIKILIASDGSTDNTDNIVKEFHDQGVKLIRIEGRKGKHFCQGKGIQQAETEIVVLSDATTFLEADAILEMVKNFADPSVGVVSGNDKTKGSNEEVSGEGAYVKYEMKLREYEALAGSLIGASGCFFAIRKHLAAVWVDNMSSDFYMPIIAKMNGFRTVPEPLSIGYYEILKNPGKEFQRKVRTVLHGIEVLMKFNRIMNPMKYGFFSLQMISHKLMRWLVPFCLLMMLLTNIYLADGGFYSFLLAAQLVLYALATIAALFQRLQDQNVFKIPLFFVMVNLSIVVAWYQYFKGEQQVVWEVTKR